MCHIGVLFPPSIHVFGSCRKAERAREEAKAAAKQAGRGEEAARKRAADADAATSAARQELDAWRAKAYGLQTKVEFK